jgi:hypothetical protein
MTQLVMSQSRFVLSFPETQAEEEQATEIDWTLCFADSGESTRGSRLRGVDSGEQTRESSLGRADSGEQTRESRLGGADSGEQTRGSRLGGADSGEQTWESRLRRADLGEQTRESRLGVADSRSRHGGANSDMEICDGIASFPSFFICFHIVSHLHVCFIFIDFNKRSKVALLRMKCHWSRQARLGKSS